MNKTAYTLHVLLKVYVVVILRAIENTIILFFHRTKLNRTVFCPNNTFKEKHLILQKEFGKTFSTYDECRNCVSHCCHSKINRFDFIDCYLNTFVLEEGLSPWHQIPHLMTATIDLFRGIAKVQKDESPNENCIYYSTSSGCVLPIGNRPWMCVAGTCFKLLKTFSNDDLRRYSFLLSKFIVFHLKCFFYLLRELSVVNVKQF